NSGRCEREDRGAPALGKTAADEPAGEACHAPRRLAPRSAPLAEHRRRAARPHLLGPPEPLRDIHVHPPRLGRAYFIAGAGRLKTENRARGVAQQSSRDAKLRPTGRRMVPAPDDKPAWPCDLVIAARRHRAATREDLAVVEWIRFTNA